MRKRAEDMFRLKELNSKRQSIENETLQRRKVEEDKNALGLVPLRSLEEKSRSFQLDNG